MTSELVDISATVQVIGCVFNNPSILDDTDKYILREEDFVEEFHRIIFGSIYNIHLMGSKVNINAIVDYLSNRPKYDAIFKKNNGVEYLAEVSQQASLDTFDYYYQRLRKFTLLRAYVNCGVDISDLYDPKNILDLKKREHQENWLDNSSLVEIAETIDKKIEAIKIKYIEDDLGIEYQAGDGAEDLIYELEKYPEVGIPLYGPLINTVTKGARLRKVYLRSGAAGSGKTRAMAADACYIGCDSIYDENVNEWISTGKAYPTYFIATEQDKSEMQTMMMAFLSGVNENSIITGRYNSIEERERVIEASRVLKRGAVWIEELHDFTLQDIENKIKKCIKQHNVSYVFYDYLHSSPKILGDIIKQTGVKLREDNVLFMLSARLKDIANKYGIFILTSTQLSGNWRDSETPDQTLLRGAKSIADKADLGCIILPVSEDDLAKLDTLMTRLNIIQRPNLKLSIYKNRRGPHTSCYLWCQADLGTCRIKPMFCTSWNFEIVDIEDIQITVAPWETNE